MIKVLFVCHGNICRSPMAEFLFKKYVSDLNDDRFYIESCATSSEEIGNPVHYGTRKILDRFGIDYSKKRAKRMRLSDYNDFDYIIAMDKNNIYNIQRIIGKDDKNKVSLLLNFAGIYRDISDPWYTGNFEQTYEDIMIGIKAFYDYINQKI